MKTKTTTPEQLYRLETQLPLAGLDEALSLKEWKRVYGYPEFLMGRGKLVKISNPLPSPNHPAPSAHTPTPWDCHEQDGWIFVTCDEGEHHGDVITSLRVYTETGKEEMANAALIVRAVNAFEPMRLALENVLPEWTEEDWKFAEQQPVGAIACEVSFADVLAMRAALALATPPERQ